MAFSKGTFYSEGTGKNWNRHIKVPKIVLGLLFPVSDMNCSNKMLIFTFSVLIKSIYIKQEQIGIKVLTNNV